MRSFSIWSTSMEVIFHRGCLPLRLSYIKDKNLQQRPLAQKFTDYNWHQTKKPWYRNEPEWIPQDPGEDRQLCLPVVPSYSINMFYVFVPWLKYIIITLRSSSIKVIFHWGHFPLWSSSIEVIFHCGCLPLRSSSIEVVFHWGHHPLMLLGLVWFFKALSVSLAPTCQPNRNSSWGQS